MARTIKLYEPHDKQLIVHDHLDGTNHSGQNPNHYRYRFVIPVCGRRWGKTTGVGINHLIKTCMKTPGAITGWVDPTYKIGYRAWRDFKKITERFRQAKLLNIREADKIIQWKNGAETQFMSAENPDALVGDGFDLLILNEAAMIKRVAWEQSLQPALADRLGQALFISTPRGRNWFWESSEKGKDPEFRDMRWGDIWKKGWISFQFPSTTNPYLHPSVVENAAKEMPERMFRQEFMAEFLDDAAAVFQGVRECQVKDARLDSGTFIPRDHPYVAGLDLAKIRDYTVLTILNKNAKIVYWNRINSTDWKVIRAAVKGPAEYYNAQIMVDKTGLGDVVEEQLRDEISCHVQGYSISTNKAKAELIQNLAIMLEHRDIVIPGDDEMKTLIDELLAFGYRLTEAGNVQYGAPSGVHDDAVISLALAAWGYKMWVGKAQHMPVIQGFRPEDYLYQFGVEPA